MATQVTLKAESREGTGKGLARKLRASGKLPAVLYGAQKDSESIVLDYHEAEHLFHSISVDNTIINLEVKGQKTPVPTLIREIQTHPFRSAILHVDFYRIQTGVAVELDVPVHLHGTAHGVKEEGGVMEQTIHDLPIRCLPKDIPEEILVEVSELGIGDAIHVDELELPEGVEVLLDGRRTVCSVQIPSVAEVEVEEEEELEPELVGEAAEEGEEVSDEEAERAEAEGEKAEEEGEDRGE
jgi:large subunit ribosomal protein L25